MSTKKLVTYAIYTAIITFMAWTPQIGFIKVSTFSFTTMLIPIVIATAHLGFSGAVFSSSLFGFWAYFVGMTTNVSPMYVAEGAGYWFINAFVTRFILGFIIGFIFLLIKLFFKGKKMEDKAWFKRPIFWILLIVAVIAQLANTILVIGTYMIIANKSFDIVIGLLTINLAIEWIIVLLIPLSFVPLIEYLRNKGSQVNEW